jgi:hypothetical protein
VNRSFASSKTKPVTKRKSRSKSKPVDEKGLKEEHSLLEKSLLTLKGHNTEGKPMMITMGDFIRLGNSLVSVFQK